MPTAPKLTPEERVVAQASPYDDDADGTLAASVVRRLHYRQARSGKRCERCGEAKPLSAFSTHSRNRDGLRHYCRICANAAERQRVNAQSGATVALSYSEEEICNERF